MREKGNKHANLKNKFINFDIIVCMTVAARASHANIIININMNIILIKMVYKRKVLIKSILIMGHHDWLPKWLTLKWISKWIWEITKNIFFSLYLTNQDMNSGMSFAAGSLKKKVWGVLYYDVGWVKLLDKNHLIIFLIFNGSGEVVEK